MASPFQAGNLASNVPPTPPFEWIQARLNTMEDSLDDSAVFEASATCQPQISEGSRDQGRQELLQSIGWLLRV